MKKILIFILLGLAALNASAEKADASKQAVIDYDHAVANQVNQTIVLTGNVIVTKGTLRLNADKAVYKDTDDGINVVLNAAPGKLATFRQKRDGGPDLWIEGEAQRIEYDERTSLVKLFGSAKIRQLDGARVTETQSEFISYDNLHEEFVSRNEPSGASKVGGGRSRMIIAPRKPRPASAPAPAAPAPTGSQ